MTFSFSSIAQQFVEPRTNIEKSTQIRLLMSAHGTAESIRLSGDIMEVLVTGTSPKLFGQHHHVTQFLGVHPGITLLTDQC